MRNTKREIKSDFKKEIIFTVIFSLIVFFLEYLIFSPYRIFKLSLMSDLRTYYGVVLSVSLIIGLIFAKICLRWKKYSDIRKGVIISLLMLLLISGYNIVEIILKFDHDCFSFFGSTNRCDLVGYLIEKLIFSPILISLYILKNPFMFFLQLGLLITPILFGYYISKKKNSKIIKSN